MGSSCTRSQTVGAASCASLLLAGLLAGGTAPVQAQNLAQACTGTLQQKVSGNRFEPAWKTLFLPR